MILDPAYTHGPFYREVFNTLRAGWWEMTFARLFGRRVVRFDGIYRVTMYRWRGKVYFYEMVGPWPPTSATK